MYTKGLVLLITTHLLLLLPSRDSFDAKELP
jgi:hypothetical protein